MFCSQPSEETIFFCNIPWNKVGCWWRQTCSILMSLFFQVSVKCGIMRGEEEAPSAEPGIFPALYSNDRQRVENRAEATEELKEQKRILSPILVQKQTEVCTGRTWQISRARAERTERVQEWDTGSRSWNKHPVWCGGGGSVTQGCSWTPFWISGWH